MSGVAGMRSPETVDVSYLGYRIELHGDTRARILDPSGRELFDGRIYAISGARRFIRGYRRETTTEPAALTPAGARATGSDKKGA